MTTNYDNTVVNGKILINAGPSPRGVHRLEQVLICPQLYAYKHRLGKDMGSKDALVKGSLVHVGLAHYYAQLRAVQRKEDPAAYHDPMDAIELAAAEFGVTGTAWKALASQAVSGYMTQYMMEKFTIIGVEDLVETMIGPYRLTARWDLVTQDSQGKFWIYDHKCLPGNTLVETEGLGAVPVAALNGTTFNTVASTPQGLAWRPARVERAGRVEVYAAVLQNGMMLRAGFDHPVLTPTGYAPMADLRPGDLVAVAGAYPDRADAPVSDELLRLAGMVLADGSFTRADGQVSWGKNDPACRASYKQALDALAITYGEDAPVEGKVAAIRTHGSTLQDRLVGLLGYHPARAAEKRLPDLAGQLSYRQIRVLLGALWSGDGAAYVRPVGTTRITYATRSIDLARGVQALLLRVGILATLTTSTVLYKGARRPNHHVTVVGRSSKIEALEFLAESPRHQNALAALGPAVLDRRTITPGGPRNPKMVNGIWWVPVGSNLCTGIEDVYDVMVDSDEHNFVADGVITHNTTGRIVAKTSERYTMALQFLAMQYMGREKFGDRFGGVRINLVGLSPLGHFHRTSPEAAPNALMRFPQIVEDAEGLIERYALRDPWGWPKAASEQVCQRPYGPCDCLDLCRWGD